MVRPHPRPLTFVSTRGLGDSMAVRDDEDSVTNGPAPSCAAARPFWAKAGTALCNARIHARAFVLCAVTGSMLAMLASACHRPTKRQEASVAGRASAEAGGVLGRDDARARCLIEQGCEPASRAELVALADRIAIASSTRPVSEQGSDARLVGDLRRRSYRTYHTKVDAREAVEQYRSAFRLSDPKLGCEPELAAVLLQAEIDTDPSTAYAALYEASRRAQDSPCRLALDGALAGLGAYRPDVGKLAEIDRRIEAARGMQNATSQADGPVVAPADTPATGPAIINAVEAFGARDAARVVISLSAPASFQVGHLEAGEGGEGPRLYIDLVRTVRGHAPKARAVGGLVQRVRLGSHQGKTRVVLDLSGPAYRRVFYLPEPFRVVIDVTNHAPSVAPSRAPGTAAKVAVQRVVIDPGHGGSDPGAIGPGGLKEKDVTLDIAHRLAPVVARELGIVAMLTRDDDRFVPLEERAARANAFHADLFVSVHCNASESSGARGLQSYVLDNSRDDVAARVAARENATSTAAGAQLGSVLSHLRVTEVSAESTRFANLIQKAAIASMAERYSDTPNGGVRSAGFYVLLGAEMPSVLFEASFISNPIEETRLGSADYRQKLADAIANAIRAYREGK
jgi:N-acetylmuramoyl-L-alanine amidase